MCKTEPSGALAPPPTNGPGKIRARMLTRPEVRITRRKNAGAALLVNPTYDANGNLTFDGTLTYAWDALNRLATADDEDTNLGAYSTSGLVNMRARIFPGPLVGGGARAPDGSVLHIG